MKTIVQVVIFLLVIVSFSIVSGVTVTNINKKLDSLTTRLTAVEQKEADSGVILPPTTTTPKPVVLFSSKLSNALDFFGDSITQGFRVSATERWSSLVAVNLGKTEQNFGRGGDQWLDIAPNIYNNHTAGNSVFLQYGVNDIARGQRMFDEMKRGMYAMILYCSLPAANIVNARNATLSANGWVNTGAYNNIGVMTSVASGGSFPNSPTITTTVNGRYIGFASTVVNSANINNNWGLTINIDNNNVDATPTPFFNMQPTAVNGGSFAPYLWIYDTGDSTAAQPHTITLTPSVQGNYADRAFVDYFYGFDAGVKGASTVTLLQPTHFDYYRYDTSITPAVGYAAAMAAYNTLLRDVVRDLTTKYLLPVNFVADTLPYDMGYTSFDLVHPLQRGHKQIANQVITALQQPTTV